ncbi:helix-turn-helix domain-containing protein [Lactobacillus crispatus]|uniref:helix-turn-helix domain-containing protein n=1 Tax=Lactobacillus crispatus TaxID=47770 RepID=UPI0028054733|nr:helix-turn-helix domain-containing protein [uncultured Lactobacillus sp.]
MKSIIKAGKDSAFDRLTKKKKIAVIRLFEGATLKSISQEIDCHINTIENWKNNEEFQQARIDYSIYALNHLLPDAVASLSQLINHSKTPAMVKLQAIQTVLKHANLLSDNGTPELDAARIRKANADARVAEARAKAMEDNGQDMEQLLDKMLDTLTKESDKESKKKS